MTLNDSVPFVSAALGGGVAFGSVKARAMVSLVPATFQKISTALTVTLTAVPAFWPNGVPVFPDTVPGVAVSPGARICNWVKAAELTTTLLEVAPITPDALKSMVMAAATLCERLVNVTTPATAARLVVPCRTPLPALRVAVTTVPLSLLRKLPNWSSIRTTGCWAKTTPAVAVEAGCVWMVKWWAAAGLMAKATLSPVESAPLLAVSFLVPARLMLRSLKEATPLVSVVLVVVPLKTPVPVLRLMLMETPGALLPKLSCASAVTAGLIATPAPVSLGCCTKARLAAAAALTTTLLEVAPTRPVALRSIVMVVATLWERLVNATTPLVAAMAVVPCSDPLPALRVAVTTVLLSPLSRLLN